MVISFGEAVPSPQCSAGRGLWCGPHLLIIALLKGQGLMDCQSSPGGQLAAPHSSLYSIQAWTCDLRLTRKVITHPWDYRHADFLIIGHAHCFCNNEVAGEEAVLGELQRAKSSTVAEFLTSHSIKFLSKLPRIIFPRKLWPFSLSVYLDYVPKDLIHTHSPLPSLLSFSLHSSLVFLSPFFFLSLSLSPLHLTLFFYYFTWHSDISFRVRYIMSPNPSSAFL